MSESLRLFKTNERIKSKILFLRFSKVFLSKFFYFLVCLILVFVFKKMSDSLIPSFFVSDVSESLRALTKNEQCEQIAQVPQHK